MRVLYRSRLYRGLVPPLLRVLGPMHVAMYRGLGGLLVGRLAQGGMPVLLLTTVGRRTGRDRTHPLGFVPDGATWLVVGSNGGLPQVPGWIANIRAEPRVSVQSGRKRVTARAAILSGTERQRAWQMVVARYGFFATYQSAITRELPIVRLSPDRSS